MVSIQNHRLNLNRTFKLEPEMIKNQLDSSTNFFLNIYLFFQRSFVKLLPFGCQNTHAVEEIKHQRRKTGSALQRLLHIYPVHGKHHTLKIACLQFYRHKSLDAYYIVTNGKQKHIKVLWRKKHRSNIYCKTQQAKHKSQVS